MKKGDIREGTVEKLSFPNKGILHVEGKKAVVKNVIPGQKIRFRVTKNRADRIEGQLIEVLGKASDERPEAACVHSGICGGCAYQNLEYDVQLRLKGAQVGELLGMHAPQAVIMEAAETAYAFSQEDVTADGVIPVYPSPVQTGYRNKMEFTFGDEYIGGPLTLGQHKRGSFYDILTVSECQIVDADFRMILTAARDFFAVRGIPYYHRSRHDGILRHLLVRKSAKTGEILIDLVAAKALCTWTDPDGTAVLTAFSELMAQLNLKGTLKGVLYTKNDSPADTIKDEGTTVLFGQNFISEEILGLRFKITPFSFFQTNSRGAEVLYGQVRRMIGTLENNPLVFDLYSGTGTIAQIIAPAAGKVIGVEIVPEAVEAARENAALNGLTNCEFICGDVLKVLDEIPEKPDYIILDPPRDGVHPKALKKIIAYGVPRMVYISCKPTSLARDLEVLYKGGYEVCDICCVDMFPGTVHVETVCLLGKRKCASAATVHEVF